MSRQGTRFWTFNSLVGAFLDRSIAYFLLCGSMIAFVAGNGDKFTELEGEASSSSISDARKGIKIETDDSGVKIEKERGFDLKGKGASNYRVRGCFRRRKNGSFDGRKHSSVSSSQNWITCVEQRSNDKEHVTGVEENSIISGDNSCNYEVQSPMEVKTNPNDFQEGIPIEQDARAALYIELEKERSTAATAADEAMAMILRLRDEKASIEMESRRYQQMIQEKSAYDEEEMNILKEIVLRREMEKHFLEKEVEAYRHTISPENSVIDGHTHIQDSGEDPDRNSSALAQPGWVGGGFG
ncbi:hypothetical protein L1887_24100 [Cichorium endivia]|nr:hypothetical protein L1887_24100 [Cichorium endivia]